MGCLSDYEGITKDMVLKLLLHSWIMCVRQRDLGTHLSWLAGSFFLFVYVSCSKDCIGCFRIFIVYV